MTVDLKATADAIAAQYAGATTSAGETFTSAPTASLPNAIAKGPVCLVYPPSGVLDVGVSRIRRDEWDFLVKILIDPLDVPSRSDALYRWVNATRDLLEANMDLGLPTYVSWARVVGARVALDGETYAGGAFDVIEYTVRVHFGDIVVSLGP